MDLERDGLSSSFLLSLLRYLPGSYAPSGIERAWLCRGKQPKTMDAEWRRDYFCENQQELLLLKNGGSNQEDLT
jgi:hypothetical protein